ncbi:MAG: FitA-like ribbon-helix-helix domain-containing protein [Gaiellaceae bacterium]
MATLYIRDVPERVYKRLRARARRNGRSLNAEVLELLDEAELHDVDAVEITARLREIARTVKMPPGAPTPEQMIHEGREKRDRKIRGLSGL